MGGWLYSTGVAFGRYGRMSDGLPMLTGCRCRTLACPAEGSAPFVGFVLLAVRHRLDRVLQRKEYAVLADLLNRLDAEPRAATVIAGCLPQVIHKEIQEARWRGVSDEDDVARISKIVSDQGDLVEQQLRSSDKKITQGFFQAFFLGCPYAGMRDGRTEKHPVL